MCVYTLFYVSYVQNNSVHFNDTNNRTLWMTVPLAMPITRYQKYEDLPTETT